jgi:cytochrome P450
VTDTIRPEDLLLNPFEPGFTDNPYPQYRRLRTTEPVHHHPFGYWVVSSHREVSQLLRSDLSVDSRKLAPRPIRDQPEQMTGVGEQTVLNLSMADRDPPDHTRLRSLVTKVFTGRAIAALEPEIVTLVDESLDRIASAGHVDLVEELAFPLPFTVISRMLGMPPTDHQRIRELSGTLVRSLEVVGDEETMRAIVHAGEELSALTRDLLDWKRANPADDLLTALIAAEHEGSVLSDEELVAQIVLLYIAGHETTVNLIANGVLALLRNPGELTRLRAEPDLITNAVEEFLRYDSPVQETCRITTAPLLLGDKEIPAGEFVIAGLASANRDETHFGPDADQLRLDRPDARTHLSFSSGRHHCLGAALARLEGRVAIGRLVSRFPDLSLAGPVVWNGRANLRGPAKLPAAV